MQNKKILSTLVTRSLRHPWLRAGGGKTKFLSEFVCVASAYNTGLTVQERNNINDGIVSLLHPNFASRPGGVGSVILGRASLVPKTPSPSWSARRPPKPPGVRQNFVRPNVRRKLGYTIIQDLRKGNGARRGRLNTKNNLGIAIAM